MNKTDRMHFLKTYGRRLATAVLGTLLFAAGVNLFIVPISLYSGGFLGIGMVLRTLLVDYAHIPHSGQCGYCRYFAVYHQRAPAGAGL